MYNLNMKRRSREEALFWRRRAPLYPAPFGAATLKRTRRIIRLLERLGARFRGARVLDIGTGTGNYALPLAARAAAVTGVDLSPAMLSRFRAEARRRRIRNARAVRADWSSVPAARFAGRFDIALASMTMAVHTRSDLLKMEKAAPARAFSGWDRVRKNPFLARVYAHHGLRYKAPPGAPEVLAALKKLGRRPRVLRISDGWTWQGTPGEAELEISAGLLAAGREPDLPWLRSLLQKKARGGLVRHATRVRKALIYWENGPGKPGRRVS